MTMLFKIITVKDDIVIGLNADELDRLGGRMPARSRAPSWPRAR